MRHVYSWQHQSTSRGRWALKRLLVELVSYLGKKLLLPGLVHKLDTKNPQREDWWTRLMVRWSFSFPDSWKSLRDILQNTEENEWTVFEISCFMENSAGYHGPEGQEWMLQQYRKTLGDCPGSEMSLSFLEFWKLLISHLLRQYYILLESLMDLKNRYSYHFPLLW